MNNIGQRKISMSIASSDEHVLKLPNKTFQLLLSIGNFMVHLAQMPLNA